MISASIECGNSVYTIRKAELRDVGTLVDLLADDPIGSTRETTNPDARTIYEKAFEKIDADDAHLLLVVATADDNVIGTVQLTFIPGLSRMGATRMQIEAVRVHEDHRSQGIGSAMLRWACEEGARRGAFLAQLTSDQTRTEAHEFYERLGFVASHIGFKKSLS
ncbi:GNAT family N-acetyltransferase [Rhodococcus sp. NPDC056743]|jgi:ribosomal protein S18 acetylase RimI-like enzyme|uniref:GNAT family N-acetyltransferase n=1 Tax=unclassified Rhodococcus (in: high G+C Gram-positive bacteria) TaxID=192944 RepID=UPI00110D580E|nr:GNAT family N-acetyltransferase [Rhodococcus sp. KBS0724]TSD48826.1 GNAT family N-acetyltransferase [Rhodococcus sp. KBS0724]